MAISVEDSAWLNAVSCFRLIRGDSYKAFSSAAGLSGPDGGHVETDSTREKPPTGAMKNSIFEAFSKLLEFRRACVSRKNLCIKG